MPSALPMVVPGAASRLDKVTPDVAAPVAAPAAVPPNAPATPKLPAPSAVPPANPSSPAAKPAAASAPTDEIKLATAGPPKVAAAIARMAGAFFESPRAESKSAREWLINPNKPASSATFLPNDEFSTPPVAL